MNETAHSNNGVGFNPVILFIAYAAKDEAYREALETHLAPLTRGGIVAAWHFRRLIPGQAWDEEIHQQLDNCDIFIPLVSSDFIASDYAYTVEFERAKQLRSEGKIEILPVIVRACLWTETPLEEIQALPDNGKAISSWNDQDEGWLSVVKGIQQVANKRLEESSSTGANVKSIDPKGNDDDDRSDLGLLDYAENLNSAVADLESSTVALNQIGSDLSSQVENVHRRNPIHSNKKIGAAIQRKLTDEYSKVLNQFSVEVERVLPDVRNPLLEVESSLQGILTMRRINQSVKESKQSSLVPFNISSQFRSQAEEFALLKESLSPLRGISQTLNRSVAGAERSIDDIAALLVEVAEIGERFDSTISSLDAET